MPETPSGVWSIELRSLPPKWREAFLGKLRVVLPTDLENLARTINPSVTGARGWQSPMRPGARDETAGLQACMCKATEELAEGRRHIIIQGGGD